MVETQSEIKLMDKKYAKEINGVVEYQCHRKYKAKAVRWRGYVSSGGRK